MNLAIADLLKEDVEWEPLAEQPMPLSTMIDFLNSLKLTRSFNKFASEPSLKSVYEQHSNLLNKIVKIMCGSHQFIPSEISKEGTKESQLFFVIDYIVKIVWYYKLNSIKKDGYNNARKEYNKAWSLVQRYSLGAVPRGFPNHKNVTLRNLEQKLEHSKLKQKKTKIISLIKKEFNIKALTLTKEEKTLKSVEEFIQSYQTNSEKINNLHIEELKKGLKRMEEFIQSRQTNFEKINNLQIEEFLKE